MLELAKWNPFKELTTLHREMDELFNRAFAKTGGLLPTMLTEGRHFPAVDFARKGDNMVIHVELPGIEPNEVEVSVAGNLLTIRGERKYDTEVKEEDYVRREIGHGVFERAIPLPEGVNTDKIKANYKKGILELTMPAEPALKVKKVRIEVEEEEKKKLKAA